MEWRSRDKNVGRIDGECGVRRWREGNIHFLIHEFPFFASHILSCLILSSLLHTFQLSFTQGWKVFIFFTNWTLNSLRSSWLRVRGKVNLLPENVMKRTFDEGRVSFHPSKRKRISLAIIRSERGSEWGKKRFQINTTKSFWWVFEFFFEILFYVSCTFTKCFIRVVGRIWGRNFSSLINSPGNPLLSFLLIVGGRVGSLQTKLI